MNRFIWIFLLTMMMFLGTVIGSSFIFLFKNKNEKIDSILNGLASGIMLSASIFSLIMPAIGNNIFILVISFFIGGIFIFLFEYFISNKMSTSNFFLAVLLHNIPEGIIVGISCMTTNDFISSFFIALGLFIQNIPEGAAIAFNINGSKKRSFIYGVISGVVEPIFGMTVIPFLSLSSSLLPVLYMFAAGTMFYVIVNELLPSNKNNITTINFIIGFTVMMFLDLLFT